MVAGLFRDAVYRIKRVNIVEQSQAVEKWPYKPFHG
jgi:hypothetical protein